MATNNGGEMCNSVMTTIMIPTNALSRSRNCNRLMVLVVLFPSLLVVDTTSLAAVIVITAAPIVSMCQENMWVDTQQ